MLFENVSEQISSIRDFAEIQSKDSRRIERLQKWEALKAEIYRLYIVEDNTPQATMLYFEEQYSLKAR